MIELRELTKVFGDVTAVDHLHLKIDRGEVVFLVGGSGCGKTTTLKMVNRLVEPTGGTGPWRTAEYSQPNVTPSRPRITMPGACWSRESKAEYR